MKNVLRDILALNNADYGEKKNSQLIKNTVIYKRPNGSFIKYKWQVLSWCWQPFTLPIIFEPFLNLFSGKHKNFRTLSSFLDYITCNHSLSSKKWKLYLYFINNIFSR